MISYRCVFFGRRNAVDELNFAGSRESVDQIDPRLFALECGRNEVEFVAVVMRRTLIKKKWVSSRCFDLILFNCFRKFHYAFESHIWVNFIDLHMS